MRGSKRRLATVVALAALAGVTACDPVCDIARVTVIGSDGRMGVPCVFELQRATDPPDAPYSHGPTGHTGTIFTLHTYRNSGAYRVVAQCEGYARGTTSAFEWKLQGFGCGAVADLGTVTIAAEEKHSGSEMP